MDDYVIHGSVSYISWAKIPPLPHDIHGRYISSMDKLYHSWMLLSLLLLLPLLIITHYAIVSHIITLIDSSSSNEVPSLSLILPLILISYSIIASSSYSHC